QMDEVEGPRLRQPSEDAVSLASSLAEPINLEDFHYAQLRGEVEYLAQNLEWESWSAAVEQSYLKSLSREAVKRQEVIYEFIQTEMHHVRTLKILLQVYLYELRRSQLMEDAKLDRLFLSVEELLSLHQHFLSCLKARQRDAQTEEGPNNYQITRFGDILVSQFSGDMGEGMVECYGVFCSHHNESMSFYKEQLQNNKKMQHLMRKIGQLPLVRRLGIPECFMLVTQRITKYPILVERIIQNTEAETEEHQALVQALALIRDAISQVDDQVSQHEKAARLREIGLRLEPKSQGWRRDGLLLRREDLLNGTRTLLHEGAVTWKSSGRHKEIQALLLSDVVVLLQEKDQKLAFAALDNKPPIISLERLIVREVAHEEKAMFLIYASDASLPDLYEIHTGSREECVTWMTLIWDAVEHYPEEETSPEPSAELQQLQGNTTHLNLNRNALRLRDEHIMKCLAEKQQMFAAACEKALKQESHHQGLLLRGDASDLQQGEALLLAAIHQAENLRNLVMSWTRDPSSPEDERFPDGQSETEDATSVTASAMKKSTEQSVSARLWPRYRSGLKPAHIPTRRLDEEPAVPESRFPSGHFPLAEVCEGVMLLTQRLYSLQAVVAQQDSQIELQNTFQSKSKQPTRHYSSILLEQEKQRNLKKHKEALANLHKLQAQHREEQQQWEKERERQRIQMEALEAQLQQREEECRKREEKLQEEKTELEEQRGNYQEGLERLRETTKSVEKEQDRLSQEKERLEQLQEKLKKLIPNPGFPQCDDPTQVRGKTHKGSVVNGGGVLATPPKLPNAPSAPDACEAPPKVPPRRESMAALPAKPELPIQLISTTNQVHKPAAVQQQIPTKLAVLAKGKDKGLKGKASHKRTNSAGFSLLLSGTFSPPGTLRSVKSTQSFSAVKTGGESPPAPPPFP
uniref:Rho/rac guanine nucleotide exchange factor (GEF) 18a n=1 Tax=Tetraodon nigroviridis TaxID=99883 RepID=H3DBQ7_TETNG